MGDALLAPSSSTVHSCSNLGHLLLAGDSVCDAAPSKCNETPPSAWLEGFIPGIWSGGRPPLPLWILAAVCCFALAGGQQAAIHVPQEI